MQSQFLFVSCLALVRLPLIHCTLGAHDPDFHPLFSPHSPPPSLFLCLTEDFPHPPSLFFRSSRLKIFPKHPSPVCFLAIFPSGLFFFQRLKSSSRCFFCYSWKSPFLLRLRLGGNDGDVCVAVDPPPSFSPIAFHAIFWIPTPYCRKFLPFPLLSPKKLFPAYLAGRCLLALSVLTEPV